MTRTTRRLIHSAIVASLLGAGFPAQAEEGRQPKLEATPSVWSLLLEVIQPFYERWIESSTTVDAPTGSDGLRVGGPGTSLERSPTLDPDG